MSSSGSALTHSLQFSWWSQVTWSHQEKALQVHSASWPLPCSRCIVSTKMNSCVSSLECIASGMKKYTDVLIIIIHFEVIANLVKSCKTSYTEKSHCCQLSYRISVPCLVQDQPRLTHCTQPSWLFSLLQSGAIPQSFLLMHVLQFPQPSSIQCFLMFRPRLCFLGRNHIKVTLGFFSVLHQRAYDVSHCTTVDLVLITCLLCCLLTYFTVMAPFLPQ